MPRQRFRQWWRDQGLITIILLAISFLLAVAGWNKGSTGMLMTEATPSPRLPSLKLRSHRPGLFLVGRWRDYSPDWQLQP